MADVVYFLKEDVPSAELRFSLRSLANLPHDRVWFIGGKPEWVTDANHVPFKGGPHKWWDLSDKFMLLPGLDGLADEFVLMSDDYFILEPVVNLAAYTTVRTLAQKVANVGDVPNRYMRSGWLNETLQVLRGLGIADPASFDAHVPSAYRKSLIPLDLYRGTPMSWRSVYGNTVGGPSEAIVPDPKVRRPHNLAAAAATGFLSSSEHFFESSGVARYVSRLFPNPSPYEKE